MENKKKNQKLIKIKRKLTSIERNTRFTKIGGSFGVIEGSVNNRWAQV